ncbi:U32 family peptidase [Oceanirhabdus sp. W0125-5]|uniref:U32 family peptidase n=1 Tax=Oceanirhabdus sp. W0125-5 TaxID=2999116 RepID=UPI0022F2A5D0|nr:U32 family peptidase [Oceanirhabdus sp. W0125-5]WBW99414.1 U32 family peptidase [Oceanirhabdus sp. W0125-5]
MKKIELLAPAGSKESLIAAVQNGADAIYLGGTKFSARAYASNFDNETIEWAIDYCHLYGVKVYVTLNTLIKDEEMEEAIEYAQFLHNVGVDAVIIQDYGLAHCLRNRLPELEIHASTQMTVHNAEGAKYLNDRGFQRIVLSRELNIKEIEKVSKEYKIETEIFVHGALCICYSGQCLMSSVLGGRSGNRGRCAQPCRLPYKILNKKGERKEGYLMSPKDICTIEDLEKIIDSGTKSLKVEGRMKRPEYVAGIVSSYRKAIDFIYEKKKTDKETIQHEKDKLMQLFNREGFSKAYLFGNIGRDMMSFKFPKNTGVKIGKVKSGKIELLGNISLNDGIRIGDGGFTISKIIKEGREVKGAFKGDKVELKPKKYKEGDTLFKTSDVNLNMELSKSYKNIYEKRIPLSCNIQFNIGYPIELSCDYGDVRYKIKGDVVQVPIKKPVLKEKIESSLQKKGETPFKIEKIIFDSYEEGFVPVSVLNELRRKLIEKIEDSIKSSYKNNHSLRDIDQTYVTKESEIPECIITVKSKEQMNVVRNQEVDEICVDITFRDMWNIEPQKLKGCYVKIPNIIKDAEYDAVVGKIREFIPYIKGIITSNLGIIRNFSNKTVIIGDYKLNIFNKYGVDFFENELNGIYLSTELNRKQLNSIARERKGKTAVVIYGKYELMVSQYCPIGATFGGRNIKNRCNRICEGERFVLNDRMNVDFPIFTDPFCRSYIYNSVPVELIWNKESFRNNGMGLRIDFIDENAKECKEVLEYLHGYRDKLDIKSTKGQFSKGVL